MEGNHEHHESAPAAYDDGSNQPHSPTKQDREELDHTQQPPAYQPHQTFGSNINFSTPVRSSHAEAQAALEAVAAAASAGKIQMTPPHSSSSSSSANYMTTPVSAAAAAAAAAEASGPSSPGGPASPFGTHLGRNKACQSCRARKLKCDGQKPVCGQCAKGWQIKFRMAQNKAKNKKKAQDPAVRAELESLPETMPPCVYLPITQRSSSRSARPSLSGQDPDSSVAPDTPQASANVAPPPMDGSPMPAAAAAKKRKRADDSNDEQVMLMQQEIDHLKQRLAQLNGVFNAQALDSQQQGGNRSGRHPSKDELAIAHMLATSMPSGEGPSNGEGLPMSSFDYQQAVAAVAANGANFDVLDPALSGAAASLPSTSAYPQPHASDARTDPRSAAHKQAKVTAVQDEMDQDFANPLLELMVTSWPADFPPPNLVNQLVSTYFEKTTAQSLFLHPSRFMENFSYGPQHPRFPSLGLLHGIFAMAYPRLLSSDIHSDAHGHNVFQGAATGEKLASLKAAAAFHAKKAKVLCEQATQQARFEEAAQIQALLCAYYYINDHSIEAWFASGNACSLLKGMELNRLPSITTFASNHDVRKPTGARKQPKPAVYRAVLKQPAATPLEHEERLRLFWNCFYSDRAACSSTHWAQSIDDMDIKTELPGAFDDFINGTSELVYRRRQTLESPDLFTDGHYDPAILHLKAAILHSKCVSHMSRLPLEASVQDVLTSDFYRLDGCVTALLQSVPGKWRDLASFDPTLRPSSGNEEPPFLNDGVNYRPQKQISLMTNQLVLAHALIHGSCISLHEPVAHRMPDSARKSAQAAQSIIKILKTFIAARVDLLQVGSFLTLMIVLAARAVTRQYKKMRREAAQTYLRLRRSHPELAQRAAEAGFSHAMSSASPASSSTTHKGSTSGATYNAFGMGLDTSASDAIDEEEAAAAAAAAEAASNSNIESGNHISTAGFSESLEDELEFALDFDPSLRAQIDPEGQLSQLRDDLELIFWSLIKYGETYQLGVGQAKVVAQLLGKDYSSELEQAGLFKRSGETSVVGSASDVGNWNDTNSPAQFAAAAAAAAGGASGVQGTAQQVPQGIVPGMGAYNGAGGSAYGPRGTSGNAGTGANASLFHTTEGGYRLGSFYLDRPQVSDYYPASVQQQHFHQQQQHK
ncbi:hypothetical protein NDA16_001274 [Ustilago loliicola]|nr:hypothetical protein NDA16_001274 [Ustilago loliicola]